MFSLPYVQFSDVIFFRLGMVSREGAYQTTSRTANLEEKEARNKLNSLHLAGKKLAIKAIMMMIGR